MSNINPTMSNTKVLDYTDPSVYKHSVDKWKYSEIDPNISRAKTAQFINDTYYDSSTFPHNIEIKWFVETYTWNMTQTASSTSDLKFDADLSDKVVDISIDVDSSSNIRQSASVTFLVDKTNDRWFMRRSGDWRLAGSSFSGDSVSGNSQSNPMWIPVVYKIYQQFIFPNDTPEVREVASTKNYIFKDDFVVNGEYNPYGNEKRSNISTQTDSKGRKYKNRYFGFFLPQSQNYSYDSTTNRLSLTLQGLSYGLTKEGGNVLVPPIATYGYWFNQPYNNSPTSKEALNITSSKELYDTIHRYVNDNKTTSDGSVKVVVDPTGIKFEQINKTAAKAEPIAVTKAKEELEHLIEEEKKFVKQLQDIKREHSGVTISGTGRVLIEKDPTYISVTTYQEEYASHIKGGTIKRPKNISIEVDMKQYSVPMPLGFAGEEQVVERLYGSTTKASGYYKRYTSDEMTSILYDLATNRTDAVLNNYHMPLSGYNLPTFDSEFTSKSEYFPNGFEFDAGVSVMDIAEKFINAKFHDGKVWVDEDRRFNFNATPTVRTYQRGYLPYRYYSELIQSEEISSDDSSYYNITEVYGKDGEYYGVYDGSSAFNFKNPLDNSPNASMYVNHQLDRKVYSEDPRIQVIQDDSLESDQECYDTAAFETWKSTRGQTTITIKLVDNYIPGTNAISHLCGNSFVEYKTMQGAGKTVICILEKASLSGNIWTWTLKPFTSFSPSYNWHNYKEYLRVITEHYDEYIMGSYRTEWVNDDENDDVDESVKNTLAQPVILGYELLEDNRLRLYISSIDIGYSIVNIYQGGNGSYNFGNFVGQSVNCNGTDSLPYGTKCATSVNELDSNHIYKIWETSEPITGTGTFWFQATLSSPYHEDSPSSEAVEIKIGEFNPTIQNVVQRVTTESGVIKPRVIKEETYNELLDEYRNILTDENGDALVV